MFMDIGDIENVFSYITVIKSIHQAHTTPCEEQINIHDRLYNNNSDYARNTKSYITTIESNKNQ